MSKRLSVQQIAEMKEMVIRGEKPDDIAKHFNIAVSSVHNYKARFKAQGESVPNVRGQRPKGSVKPVAVSSTYQVERPNTRNTKTTKQTDDRFNFVVNGISVQISSQAVSVNIDKNKMEINF